MEGGDSSNVSTQAIRDKNDPGWAHFSLTKDVNGKNKFRCLHCGSVYSGGGINRMKQHLAGVKGNIAACKKVSLDVRHQMQENLKGISGKKQETQEARENIGIYDEHATEELASAGSQPSRNSITEDKGKRKIDEIDNFFAPRTSAGS
ncbi:hypothetical protein KSP39_PZI006543 [Platanthera zijinensis]|uniref:BED-type domain-containing protein n=1 Tax=Platanthera zijinensis TaxID=2320716 RepID=A0AAP0BQ22_9ASPA